MTLYTLSRVASVDLSWGPAPTGQPNLIPLDATHAFAFGSDNSGGGFGVVVDHSNPLALSVGTAVSLLGSIFFHYPSRQMMAKLSPDGITILVAIGGFGVFPVDTNGWTAQAVTWNGAMGLTAGTEVNIGTLTNGTDRPAIALPSATRVFAAANGQYALHVFSAVTGVGATLDSGNDPEAASMNPLVIDHVDAWVVDATTLMVPAVNAYPTGPSADDFTGVKLLDLTGDVVTFALEGRFSSLSGWPAGFKVHGLRQTTSSSADIRGYAWAGGGSPVEVWAVQAQGSGLPSLAIQHIQTFAVPPTNAAHLPFIDFDGLNAGLDDATQMVVVGNRTGGAGMVMDYKHPRINAEAALGGLGVFDEDTMQTGRQVGDGLVIFTVNDTPCHVQTWQIVAAVESDWTVGYLPLG